MHRRFLLHKKETHYFYEFRVAFISFLSNGYSYGREAINEKQAL
jgi:hypothetical protein